LDNLFAGACSEGKIFLEKRLREPAMKLAEVLSQYPLISLAQQKDQESIFRIIDATSLSTDKLQIYFDRRPDFFSFLQCQADKAFVFLMHNEDGSTEGMACLSFRRMWLDGQRVCIGYASDLRITEKLGRHCRVQWRACYDAILESLEKIKEFEGAIGLVTAVWDDNALAQKALVSKKRSHAFTYNYLQEYQAVSIWGRWRWQSGEGRIRPVSPDEIPLILEILCEAKGQDAISWDEAELKRTIHCLGLDLLHFQVLEEHGMIQAVVLPIGDLYAKKLKIRKLPRVLGLLSKLIKINFGEEVKTLQLMFFQSRRDKKKRQDLLQFLNYFYKDRKDRQLISVYTWNDKNLTKDLWRQGFCNSAVSGKLYRVQGCKQNVTSWDLRSLEIGLL
jgi:hypothetical protein